MYSKTMREDMEYIMNSSCIDWNMLSNSNILVSGATGLIGSTIVKALIYADLKLGLGLNVYCIVRDVNKAKSIFGEDYECKDSIHYVISDVTKPISSDISFDYIIHGASSTASSFFVNCPVETINTAIIGTSNLLECAKRNNTRGFVYLSSMEAYGHVTEELLLAETMLAPIDITNIRNCYPESKRICELLCTSYAAEYEINAKSVRLAQTFGPGISIDDNRVFAMMARCAIEQNDIVLLTKGTSRHPYLYTAQAAEAILCVLLYGKPGETYNASNPETYCSIYEMGEMICREIADDKIKVRISETDDNKKYPPAGFLNLDIGKIKELGWNPSGSLVEMYQRMMSEMKKTNANEQE